MWTHAAGRIVTNGEARLVERTRGGGGVCCWGGMGGGCVEFGGLCVGEFFWGGGVWGGGGWWVGGGGGLHIILEYIEDNHGVLQEEDIQDS